jgi:hypothetical protein
MNRRKEYQLMKDQQRQVEVADQWQSKFKSLDQQKRREIQLKGQAEREKLLLAIKIREEKAQEEERVTRI